MFPGAHFGEFIGDSPSTSNPPLVVTAWSTEQTRRWPVLLASVGLRIARPGEELRGADLPALHVHIEPHDAWLSWIRPAGDRDAYEQSLRCWWWSADAWLEGTGRRPADVARFEGYARLLSALFQLGWEPAGEPGNLRWLEFTERGRPLDWRIVADSIAAVVRGEACQD